jgi:hypothetical protein
MANLSIICPYHLTTRATFAVYRSLSPIAPFEPIDGAMFR